MSSMVDNNIFWNLTILLCVMSKLSFSGHESFACKQFWLKKGFDFIHEGRDFNAEEAVVHLGVGKNMVRSIRFWLHAFGISEERSGKEASTLGSFLFGDDGADPYLEDIGSIWLLHYYLVKNATASIYNLVFNQLRRTKTEFTVDQLHNYIKRICLEQDPSKYNQNTVERDIRVFVHNYQRPRLRGAQVEDAYTSLLHELGLLNMRDRQSVLDDSTRAYLAIPSDARDTLPEEILFFAMLDLMGERKTITLAELLRSENSPGNIFALSTDGLVRKLELICAKYPMAVYSETAGAQQLQIIEPLDKWKPLYDYYSS